MDRLFIEKVGNTLKLAQLKDSVLTDFIYIEKSAVNNIYLSKVLKLLPGNDAAFVEIAPGSCAYLSLRLDSKIPKQGDYLVVRIDRDARGSKSARATQSLVFAGKLILLMPNSEVIGVSKRIEDVDERERLLNILKSINSRGFGLIARTCSYGANANDMLHEYEMLLSRHDEALSRAMYLRTPTLLYEDTSVTYEAKNRFFTRDFDEIITSVPQMLDELKDRYEDTKLKFYHDKGVSLFKFYGIDTKIAIKLERRVELDCGGNIIIERAEAFTAVDVNSGRTDTAADKAQKSLIVNTEAAVELAKQLRYRSIFGMVVVDFIDMIDDADRHTVRDAFQNEANQDSYKVKVFGFTNMGLFELVRENV